MKRCQISVTDFQFMFLSACFSTLSQTQGAIEHVALTKLIGEDQYHSVLLTCICLILRNPLCFVLRLMDFFLFEACLFILFVYYFLI